MMPRPRRPTDSSGNRPAAGLLLLFPIHEETHLVLTVRSETLGRHSGQVSLPGGVTDPGETFEQAALREAHEEIGLTTTSVRILGALTPIDIPSGFRLHPIVGAVRARPVLTPADDEVARVLEVPLAELLEPSRRILATRMREGQEVVVPAFAVDGVEIWGATAMVLAELLAFLGWTG